MSVRPASNRTEFPPEELLMYKGKWVAFSPDGSHIVAAHEQVKALAELVKTAGYDPQDVWFEGVPEEDTIYGGGLI
jgi:hypothetical protein